ncbi:GntP family permease [Snuella sedimenti]|uniref:Gluconate transporter n=1 Tax=Snuella sedimenti TaxID=2798802 RepID=A0A8J7IHX8_9FLAO|nr:gluconate:H+ symporter [Snuella sedimenti]MBJ6368973.1 gluconate transporter [Snuella sedimenti]
MIDFTLLSAVLIGIIILLVLILYFKIQAFIALLIASIGVGVLSGMSPLSIIKTIQEGMGNTLGFVAVVVGLGAMFGAILEHSGGAESLAKFLINKFGEKYASWALMLTGFLVAIPVFFDVAFIILVPIIYALQRKTGKSLLLYGIPLLAGLAITHSFIPPTPGPVAVADIIKVNLGWVILMGFIVGIPTAIVCGPIFAKYIAKHIHIEAPKLKMDNNTLKTYPSVRLILSIIATPIVLIILNTLFNSPIGQNILPQKVAHWLTMIGHPFSALIIANLIAWYALGILKGFSKEKLLDITTQSMGPAGIIILLTGAGGVFKQMLVNTGTGTMLANYFSNAGISILLFAFIAAALVRILQGSATVAMITAAGLTSPLITDASLSEPQKALIVIAIASGATIMSHVNDSGFWLVSKYLGLSEKQTFKSWTVMTTILALIGLASTFFLSLLI